MSQIAYTMPEAKFRSTKKRAQQPNRLTMSSLVASSALATAPLAGHTISQIGGSAPIKLVAKAKKAEAKDKKSFFAPASWWPVAVGVFLSGFAPEWHTMAAQAGVWTLRAAFPLTLLATHREIGMDDHFAAIAPQLALYLQLPLEGFMTKLSLDRGMGLKAAVVQLMLLHGVCVLVLWLLSRYVS